MFTAVCTAGSGSSKSEILELCLPPKLFADENKVRTYFFTDDLVSRFNSQMTLLL